MQPSTQSGFAIAECVHGDDAAWQSRSATAIRCMFDYPESAAPRTKVHGALHRERNYGMRAAGKGWVERKVKVGSPERCRMRQRTRSPASLDGDIAAAVARSAAKPHYSARATR